MKKRMPLILLSLLMACSTPENPAELKDPLGEMESKEMEEVIEPKEEPAAEIVEAPEIEEPEPTYDGMKSEIINRYQGVQPTTWGENVPGVLTNIATEEKLVALTFDACDGTPGSFDQELIDFLIAEEIPATLFIGGQWIEQHQQPIGTHRRMQGKEEKKSNDTTANALQEKQQGAPSPTRPSLTDVPDNDSHRYQKQ